MKYMYAHWGSICVILLRSFKPSIHTVILNLTYSRAYSNIILNLTYFQIYFAFLRLTVSYFFVKFANQNFHSVRTFVFRETSKFLFKLQAQYLTPKSVKPYTIFLQLDSILAKIFGGIASKPTNGELTVLFHTP